MKSRHKKVLFVAYFFPPLGGGGVPRSVKFVKYLPLFDWQPVVLTSNTKDYHAWDANYLEELPENLNITRTQFLNLQPFYEVLYKLRLDPVAHYLRKNENQFLLPDRQVGWLPDAYRQGLRTIEKENIELIYSSAPPYTGHLVARCLKRKTGLPWVADFRDEWSDYGFIKRGFIAQYLQKRWERGALEEADAVVTTTPWITHLLRGKLSKRQDKCITITNGYDRWDFDKLKSTKNTDTFLLAHAGSFYGSRMPDSILNSITELIQRKFRVPSALEIHFIGGAPDVNQVKRLNLPPNTIHCHGYLSHQETLQKISKATALILIQSCEGRRCIPGKVYEYLALKKPILALVPKPSAVADLLCSVRGVYMADINNPSALADAFLKLYYDWRETELPNLSHNQILDSFEYRNLTRQLANIFDSVSIRKQVNTEASRIEADKKNNLEVEACSIN